MFSSSIFFVVYPFSLNFFKEKYGEWIVYKPPLNKVNFVLWLFPYLVFAIGGVIIFLLFKKRDNH